MRGLDQKHKKSERQLGRRVFLKALGAGIAAPLAFQMGRLAMAEPGAAPVRLFIYFVPHGMPMEYAEPYGSGATFLAGSRVLSALAPFGKYVNVCRGLGINGFGNHEAVSGVLTGVKDGAGADSIDFTIAQALGVNAYNLGAVPYKRYDDGTGFDKNSYLVRHGGVWVRPMEDPATAASELLGSVGAGQQQGGGPAEPDDAAFRREALGLTERQLERLHRSLQGITKEQNKLSVHLESLRALKGSGDKPVVNACATRPALPALDALAGKNVFDQSNMRAIIDAHLEVAANAMVCGTARVITMQSLWVNCDLPMSFTGGPGSARPYHAETSHSRDDAGRQEFARVQGWFFERLAEKLLATLDQPDPLDPGNTVLHNSLIYICSEIGDGADHNSNVHDVYLGNQIVHSYLPAILIGNAGGYIAHREVVDVETFHVNMLATLAEAMGVSVTQIGGQSAKPIQELKS